MANRIQEGKNHVSNACSCQIFPQTLPNLISQKQSREPGFIITNSSATGRAGNINGLSRLGDFSKWNFYVMLQFLNIGN